MLKVLETLYSFPYYPIFVGYCIWRLLKRAKGASSDGIIGYSPEWEILGSLAIGPLLAPIDIAVTIYKWIKSKLWTA